MAEVAALALAASIATNMGFMQVSFFTNSSQLLQFLSTPDQTNLPDWRMKTYTQQFQNSIAHNQTSLFRISRSDNSVVDSLAKDAHHQVAMLHMFISLVFYIVPLELTPLSANCFRHCFL
jgi:ribonuclease HI